MGHRCLNCNKPITYRFAICVHCEAIFGNSALGWPSWLRFLWNDTQRTRRRERTNDRYQVPFSDIEALTE